MFSDLFISVAHAEEVVQSVSQPSTFQTFMPLAIIMAVFYFFIIRPQSKKYKEHQSLVDDTKIGDEVIVLNGLFGKIASVDKENCTIEIAKGVEIKVYKSTILKNISLDERRKQEGLKNAGAKK